jgi:hypothetical protein
VEYILNEYHDVFSLSKMDLGCAVDVEHCIFTAAYVWENFHDVAFAQLQSLLTQALILAAGFVKNKGFLIYYLSFYNKSWRIYFGHGRQS